MRTVNERRHGGAHGDRLATDDEAQAVIITGSGRAFSM
jgi:enoyl-CoA hydratase/carnithine racemase